MKRLLFSCVVILALACGNDTATKKSVKAYSKIAGETMGTTYHITYSGKSEKKYQQSIDSLLIKINQEVSTYEKDAIISLFNRSEKGVDLEKDKHAHFLKNYHAAIDIHQATSGHFDPTVMPLVNYWGFGYSDKKGIEAIDSLKINELLELVGMSRVVKLDESLFLSKNTPDVQLDFSAHAKGYGVDQVCALLDDKAIENYYVEIGGELRVKGKNPAGVNWITGINKPTALASTSDFMFKIQMDNEAIATSGNYRNVYEVGGIKYFHTINPFTGYPQRNRLLSASVIAADCMTADAYATAFMVMGLDSAFAFAQSQNDIKAAFIYSDEAGEMQLKKTDGLVVFE